MLKFFAVFALTLLTANASFACSWSNGTVLGEYGGFTFYRGLIVQTDMETGKKLTANQAVTVSSLAECAQVCLNDRNCQGVSHRPTSSGQCLTFAGYDFETNRHMNIYLHTQQGIKYKSAAIRTKFQGDICR
ncbi:PAN domain-containing protein [Lentilitoribacter sp. EG35]|uniref:PAN domain-containing protein n=1 Tax=Lentilitoribacter sp. EG35 TaxID=3234192 RepID=UPI00345F99CE